MLRTKVKLLALVAPTLLAVVMGLAGCGDHGHRHGDRGYIGDTGPVYREDFDRHEYRNDGGRHVEERHEERHEEHHDEHHH